MDTKSLSFNFGEGEVEKLKEILQRTRDFIVYFEVAEKKMTDWQRGIETMMQQQSALINEQLADVYEASKQLREITTEMGAARWRVAAETALQQGKEHLRALDKLSQEHLVALQSSNEEFKKNAKQSFERLDRASTYTIKNISEAISSFRLGDFQRLTDHSCELVEEASSTAIKRVTRLVKWFHWKNLGLAFAVTLFASLTMGLYLNDEMPWESHKKVMMERHAGEALIKAWPTLSQAEKRRIVDHTRRFIDDSSAQA